MHTPHTLLHPHQIRQLRAEVDGKARSSIPHSSNRSSTTGDCRSPATGLPDCKTALTQAQQNVVAENNYSIVLMYIMEIQCGRTSAISCILRGYCKFHHLCNSKRRETQATVHTNHYSTTPSKQQNNRFCINCGFRSAWAVAKVMKQTVKEALLLYFTQPHQFCRHYIK